MPRPMKCRQIGFYPQNTLFTPANPYNEEVVLSLEEVEALRLSDFEELDQMECAQSMGISRGTLQRILNAARKKAVDAIVNGKLIKIEGGNYKLNEDMGCCHRRRHRGGRGSPL